MTAIETPKLEASTRPTLFDVANVIEAPGYQLFVDHEYETFATTHGLLEIPDVGVEKTFEKRSDLDPKTPVRFGAYQGLDEFLLRGEGKGAEEVARLFALGEALWVERNVQELVLGPVAVDITPTPGTAVTNIKAAVGMLEQYMAENYLYRPVITGSIVAVSLIEDTKPPSSLQTVANTPIGIAAGYGVEGPDGTDAGAGKAWLYISGQINIWRGETSVDVAEDLKKNRELSLAERRYAATVDGPVAAILVGF
jgi:hypothetical protein